MYNKIGAKMGFITSEILKHFLERDKRKFEGLLPELIKRLILCNCHSVSNIRMPGLDDVWAPGFDGIVESQESTTYVAEGKSVWEFGTNADSLSKINSDYKKRTNNPLGIDKATTTFYLVIPKIWAYDNQGVSRPKWESDRKNGGWRDVHVYDAPVLCDWINSEPAVCAWLFEQYGEGKYLSFTSVTDAWEAFSNHTNPPLTFSMFLEGRQDEASAFKDTFQQKMCRVRSTTFIDAYGFCLSALMQNPETSNQVVVVNNENTYYELMREFKGKVFLLSFPFSGQVSDDNKTIVCYSKESPHTDGMIELPALWKSQFTNALRDMGLSDTQASEHYAFTHGSLLSLIRRIPGNAADSRPGWADAQNIELLYPIVFLRQYCSADDLEKRVLEAISGINYTDLESKYESFLRMEDAPLKKINDSFFLVNYEEAWMTLQVDVSDVMSSRMHETVTTLLTECQDVDEYLTQPQASIIKRLIYNYIGFAETGSDRATIDSRVKAILEFAKCPGCKEILLKSLSDLAEAAPVETLSFVESELENGVVFQAFSDVDSWSSSYHNVLWALDKLVQNEDTAIRACRVLYNLCKIEREYRTVNSPKDSLLNALCLWTNHTAITIGEKTRFAIWLINNDYSFGVPFAIELIKRNSVFRGVRIGEKNREYGSVTIAELYSAYTEIASAILNTAIKEKRVDWISKALEAYWYIPREVLISSSELLAAAEFSPEQKMPIIYQIKSHLYFIQRGGHDNHSQWIEPLNKWLECLIADDPVSLEGWRFYKTYHAPFPELLSETEENYLEIEQRTREIRERVFTQVRDRFGKEAITRLANCMEDSSIWGVFLGKCLAGDEFMDVAISEYSSRKMQLLSGLIDTADLPIATQIYSILSKEDQEYLLPFLHRNDIDDWLDTPEKEQLYWQGKQLIEYDERAYHYLMKYNPCGILRMFFQKEDEPGSFERLIEVVRAIVDTGNYSDSGLLTLTVQDYDDQNYSEEWALLCLELYDKSAFRGSSDYYPTCLKTYFFLHPERIVERYFDDARSFYGHFHYDYMLPNKAYESYETFLAWVDYLYEAAEEEPFFLSTLGSILGRSVPGGDGIFPHEYVRVMLEYYSNDVLTREVAIGWLNARGARFVQDGFNEKRTELQYRGYARAMELEYPQTAKILSIIADDYARESKHDQVDSELFPQ